MLDDLVNPTTNLPPTTTMLAKLARRALVAVSVVLGIGLAGVVFARGTVQRGASVVWVVRGHPVIVNVAAPPGNGPGGYMRIIATAMPIDENACQFNAWRLREVSGWQGAMFRFMFNTLYEQRTWDLIEQDREMLESMPPYPPQETLYQHDVGVLALRKYLREQAEAEVRATCVAEPSACSK